MLVRLTLLAALASVAWLVAAPGAAPPSSAQAAARPNIVFVMTDDQTLESLRVMSNVQRRLGGEGTTFTQAITTFPLCCPSRATYLTGQYSHNHGVIHNFPRRGNGGYIGLDHAETLPVWLQRGGYRTIHVGRHLNGYGWQQSDVTEVPPGWDEWHATVDPSTYDADAWQMNENGTIVQKPGPLRPFEHRDDFLGRRAVELIEASAPSAQPFFLSLTFVAPHSSRPRDPDDPDGLATPSPPPRHRDAFAAESLPRPPSFDEAGVRDKPAIVAGRPRLSAELVAAIEENYRQELESLLGVDEAVGDIFGALERSGELDDTLVIFTSDNGFFHGEHRVVSEKTLPYEPAIRVPLLMRGPGVPRGERRDQLVGNIDLAPTILDAADAAPGRVQDGRSLFELLDDPGLELGRELVLENGRGSNGIPRYRGLRNGRFVYARYAHSGEEELYDLRRDPHQLRSLHRSRRHEPIRRLLAARLRGLVDCAGPACGSSSPALRLALRERSARRRRRGARVDGRCARPVRLTLAGEERARVIRARYLLGRRRLQTRRRSPFRVAVPRRLLRSGKPATVRARVTMVDGRVVTLDRRLRCSP